MPLWDIWLTVARRGRFPKLEAVPFRIGSPAETTELRIFRAIVDWHACLSQLGQHGVEVPDTVVDHQQLIGGAEIRGVARKGGPNGLLADSAGDYRSESLL